MKRLFVIVLLLTSILCAKSQDYRRWENHIYAGQGFIYDYKDGQGEGGMSFVAGYGLSYRMSPHWSVMPGVALRSIGEDLPAETFEGDDSDTFTFLDVPLLVRYHRGVGKGDHSFGIGPVLSFCVGNDTFYIDADPRSPLNHLNKCKKFSLGLQPTFSYQFARHLNVSLDAYFCLTNLKQHHGLTTGNTYIHSLTCRMTFLF